MEDKLYRDLQARSDSELFDFITETDASQRKWVALHLLELRRNKAIASAAKSSAIAAWAAAIGAGASAVVAVLAYVSYAPHL